MLYDTPFTTQIFNRIRLRQLALLLATQDLGTLRAAAASLGMTQPAASKMLHELEHSFGYPLFDRVGRGLTLNAAGKCALNYAQSLKGNMAAMGRELAALEQNSAGKLSIGSIMAASSELITDGILHLKTIMPKLPIAVTLDTSDHLMSLLRDGELDLVIGRLAHLPAKEYEFRALDDELLSVVVGKNHPLSRLKKVTFNQLMRYPWILQPTGSPMRSVIDDEFATQRATVPEGLVETGSILTTTNLIAKTHSVAIIPQSIAQRYAEHQLLVVLPYQMQHQLAAYGSITKRGRPLSQGAARFLEWLHRAPAR
jgi:DNA-binding transcriptional LysR family regulator